MTMMMRKMFLSLLAGLLLVSVLSAQLTLRVTSIPSNTPTGSEIYAAGSFNGWNAGSASHILAQAPNGTYELVLNIAPGPIEFKFTRGAWASVEGSATGGFRPNRTFNYTGGAQVLELGILSWEDQGTGGGGTAADNVYIVSQNFYMPQLDRNRRIWIYLPPNYGQTALRYPVLYMHDAQNLFDNQTSFAGEWQIDETLNQLFAEGDGGAIVVGIDNGGGERINELTPWANPTYGGGQGAAYTDFIVETLKPYIDANYRTRPERDYTGIMGSSLGGLLSMYAAIEHQAVFSKAGIFSPSFWFSANAYAHVAQTGKQANMRIYLMGGTQESATMVSNLNNMYNTLRDAGFGTDELLLVTHPDGAHSEWYWRREFGPAYEWLFAGANPTSVHEMAQNYPLLISPNPADSMLTVQAEGMIASPAVALFAQDGKPVKPYRALPDGLLDVSDLPSGLYHLMFYDGHKLLAVRKVVVSR